MNAAESGDGRAGKNGGDDLLWTDGSTEKVLRDVAKEMWISSAGPGRLEQNGGSNCDAASWNNRRVTAGES